MLERELIVYPYKMGSKAAKLLADALDCFRVYGTGDYKPKPHHVLINWGNGFPPQWDTSIPHILNRPEKVCNSVNKIDSFYLFMDNKVSIPVWTQYREWALKWLKNGEWAVARKAVEGMDGYGLELIQDPKKLPDCNLYTKYVPIDKEWRVYVFKDHIIDVLEKRRKNTDDADPFIRTEANGWVFCKGEFTLPAGAAQECIKAVSALGLDFGGVDIIYNTKAKQSYVLEVNSAPGIGGDTVVKFKKAILDYVKTLPK